jgi:hypothetical protein
VLALTFAVLTAACGGTAAVAATTQPSAKPPSSASVTVKNPGGDAQDREKAALERLATEPWGTKKDRWRTLLVPLADWKKWRRVRLWGQPTRATYRYGDDHFAVASIWYQPIEGPSDPDKCLAKFLAHAIPLAESFDVRLGPPRVMRGVQSVEGKARPLLIELVDGKMDSVFGSDEYVGAVVSYESWPGTCLVHSFAAVSTRHRDLALRVRDRWVAEGAPRLIWDKKLKEAPPTLAR